MPTVEWLRANMPYIHEGYEQRVRHMPAAPHTRVRRQDYHVDKHYLDRFLENAKKEEEEEKRKKEEKRMNETTDKFNEYDPKFSGYDIVNAKKTGHNIYDVSPDMDNELDAAFNGGRKRTRNKKLKRRKTKIVKKRKFFKKSIKK